MSEAVQTDMAAMGELEQRVLLLPPTARDGEAIGALMAAAGIACLRCGTVVQACAELARGAGVLLWSEEALVDGVDGLAAYVDRQPVWSDLPVLVLARQGPESPRLAAAVARVGNVTVIERPMRVGTLLSVVRAALRARGRQYEVRAHLAERAAAEAALRESEEKYRTLFESIDEGFCVIEVLFDDARNPVDYRFVQVNPAFQTQSGMCNVIGRRMLEFVESIEPHWLANYGRVALSGEPVRFGGEYKGLHRWFEVYAFRVATPDEHRVAVLFTDVTERKRAEAALRQSEEQFRTFTETAPAMLWVTDPDGMCTFLSRGWYEFTGQTEAEALGLGCTSAIHSEDRQRAALEFLAARKAYAPRFGIEYRLKRADGTYRWAMDFGRARFSPDGRFLGYVGNVIDIDEQKRAADELARHRENLQAMVDERTLQLEATHRQLRLSERMAALGTLSAGLGHDMGNLLLPIRVRLESLASADLPENLKEDVAAIQTAAEYLRKLSAGLRQLALDPGKSAAGEATELSSWWQETEPMLRNSLPRGVTLNSRVAMSECWVRFSRPALTQAVFNLVQNAGDAMREAGGTVIVWSENSKRAVRLGVTDNGPGMTPEVKARCMEPFFTTKTRGISTGMGLALVYGLVADAGGSVQIESEPGRGTTFVLSLCHGSTPAAMTAASPSGKTAVVEVRNARLRALVTAELRSLAFNLVTDAKHARPDVLVLDDPTNLKKEVSPSSVVLLASSGGDRSGVIAIGERPSPKAIRDALTKAANGRERER